MRIHVWRLFGLAAVLLASGCGKNTSELSGNVTFNGSTLRYGQVSLFNEKKEQVSSSTIIEGAYAFPDLQPGSYSLTVMTVGPFGEAVGFEAPQAPAKDRPPVPVDVKKSMLKEKSDVVQKAVESLTPIPLKYLSAETTDLKVTVAGAKTPYDIVLTGKGEKPPTPKLKF